MGGETGRQDQGKEIEENRREADGVYLPGRPVARLWQGGQ